MVRMQSLFKINKYISISLEGKNIILYVLNIKFKEFTYSKYNKIVQNCSFIDKINLDDNAILDNLKKDLENIKNSFLFYKLLYFWISHKYNTNFLDYQISFPILKKLVQVGDPKAKKVFYNEILKNLWGGDPLVIKYLMRENYYDYLVLDGYKRNIEFITSFNDIKQTIFLYILSIALFLIIDFNYLQPIMGLNKSKIFEDLEIWRLLTSIFTHITEIGILVNSSLLLVFGSLFERNNIFHSSSYFILFIFSGIIGNISYLLIDPNPVILDAGGSGGIFGLIGAFTIILLAKKRIFYAIITCLITTLFLFMSFQPGINFIAHLFGFISGLIFDSLLYGFYHFKNKYKGINV